MKSEIRNEVLVIPLEGSVVGEHVNGPILTLIKNSIESGNRKVLFNLLNVRFVDSTGLGMLLSASSKVKSANGKVALCSVPDQLTKLLKMTKLENAFNQLPDESAGINFLTQ